MSLLLPTLLELTLWWQSTVLEVPTAPSRELTALPTEIKELTLSVKVTLLPCDDDDDDDDDSTHGLVDTEETTARRGGDTDDDDDDDDDNASPVTVPVSLLSTITATPC